MWGGVEVVEPLSSCDCDDTELLGGVRQIAVLAIALAKGRPRNLRTSHCASGCLRPRRDDENDEPCWARGQQYGMERQSI
jgi:hypothetical protein